MTSEEYKALSVKEFTEAAKVYDSGHSGIYEMCKDDYPYLLEELEKEPFDSVLDCGCGTGPVIELLHEKYPDKHYTGLDLTPEMIRVAQAKPVKYQLRRGRLREHSIPWGHLRCNRLFQQLPSLSESSGLFQ